MTNTQTEGFPSRIVHTCDRKGLSHLQGRWLDDGELYRATCSSCNTIIYWDEDGNTEVYDTEDPYE